MRKTSEAKTIFGIIWIHVIYKYMYIYGPNKMKTQQTRLETWTCWRRLCTCFFIRIPSVESSTTFHLASFSSNHLDSSSSNKNRVTLVNKIIKLPYLSLSLKKMSFLHPSFPSIGDFWGTFGSAPLLWAFHRFGCGPNLRHPHHGRSHHPNPKSTSVWDFSERGGNETNRKISWLTFCPTPKKIGCEILMAKNDFHEGI